MQMNPQVSVTGKTGQTVSMPAPSAQSSLKAWKGNAFFLGLSTLAFYVALEGLYIVAITADPTLPVPSYAPSALSVAIGAGSTALTPSKFVTRSYVAFRSMFSGESPKP